MSETTRSSQPPPNQACVPVRLVFDGGSRGNPGEGYGSYQVIVADRAGPVRRLQFGPGYTNNQAEYDTLIAALEEILRRATNPKRACLEIVGDSELVIRQITGRYRVRDAKLQPRAQRVHELLEQFGGWQATWQPRAMSVATLGH